MLKEARERERETETERGREKERGRYRDLKSYRNCFPQHSAHLLVRGRAK